MPAPPADLAVEPVNRTGSKTPRRRSKLLRGLRGPIGVFVGLGLPIVLGLVILGPSLAPLKTEDPVGLPDLSPSVQFIFGTDNSGLDVFSRTLVAARLDIGIGLLAAVAASLLGSLIGLLLAGRDSIVSDFVLRVIDTLQALPTLIISFTVVALSHGSIPVLVVMLALFHAPLFVRSTWTSARAVRELEFVHAARRSGEPWWRVTFAHIGTEQHRRERGPVQHDRGMVDPGDCRDILSRRRRSTTDSGMGRHDLGGQQWPDSRLLVGVDPARVGPRLLRALVRRGERGHPSRDDGQPMNVPSKLLLSVQDLAVAVDRNVGRLDLFRGLSFDLHAGEVIAITGENGVGKSTLGRVLVGLHRQPVWVVAGRVMFEDRDVLEMSNRELVSLRRDSIRFVLQEGVSALDPVETVGWQLHSVLRSKGIKGKAERAAQIRSMLDDLGLPDERLLHATPRELSGGQGKRIVIAETLLSRPKVIVADEVTAGLDLIRASEVVDIFVKRARDQGCGIIMVSHDPVTVGRVADVVLHLTRPATAHQYEATDA